MISSGGSEKTKQLSSSKLDTHSLLIFMCVVQEVLAAKLEQVNDKQFI